MPRHESLDLRLALADEAERHRLHAPGRAAARQLAPEQRREPVADQVVECAPRLPGPHQVHVDVAGPRQGRAHRRRRHLVEGDPVHRHVADGVSFREPFEHLPGDRLALPVGIRRQHQGLGVRERLRHRRSVRAARLPVSVTIAKPSSGFTEPALAGRSRTWPRVAITR